MSTESATTADDESTSVEDSTQPIDVVQLAASVFKDIIDETLQRGEFRSTLYDVVQEHDQLTGFIESIIGALADDIACGVQEYVARDETYLWMMYFFLHFCGFQFFLDNLDEMKAQGLSVEDAAEIIVDLIDRVAESEFMHADSDLPEHVAKNVIWQILNSSAMRRRYEGQSVSYCQAGDILDELINAAMSSYESTAQRQRRGVDFEGVEYIELEPSQLQPAKVRMKMPKVCKEYLGLFNVAEEFVDSLLSKSHAVTDTAPTCTLAIEKSSQILIHTEHLIRDLVPTIASFTIELGARALCKIIEVLNNRNFQQDWLYAIRFVMSRSDACSNYHTYECKFGLPTPLYPIPQGTCSVLFRLEVSRVKPPQCPISITFQLEGNGYTCDLDEHALEEKWLLHVINAKVRLFSRLHLCGI